MLPHASGLENVETQYQGPSSKELGTGPGKLSSRVPSWKRRVGGDVHGAGAQGEMQVRTSFATLPAAHI